MPANFLHGVEVVELTQGVRLANGPFCRHRLDRNSSQRRRNSLPPE